MRNKKMKIVITVLVICVALCACGYKSQQGQNSEGDAVNIHKVVDGKLYITEDMKAELDEFVGTIDAAEEKSKAEVSVLTDARTYTVSAALEIKWTNCNIISFEKIDDYQYQMNAKIMGNDAVTGESVEIEFTGRYYYEEDENKTSGYKLVTEHQDLSDKIWEIKGWL